MSVIKLDLPFLCGGAGGLFLFANKIFYGNSRTPSPKLTHLLACYYIETCSDCSRNVVVYTNTTCILDFQGVTELNRVTTNIHFAFHKGFVSFAFEFY